MGARLDRLRGRLHALRVWWDRPDVSLGVVVVCIVLVVVGLVWLLPRVEVPVQRSHADEAVKIQQIMHGTDRELMKLQTQILLDEIRETQALVRANRVLIQMYCPEAPK